MSENIPAMICGSLLLAATVNGQSGLTVVSAASGTAPVAAEQPDDAGARPATARHPGRVHRAGEWQYGQSAEGGHSLRFAGADQFSDAGSCERSSDGGGGG